MARFKPNLRRAFCGALRGLDADCVACGSKVFLGLGFAGGGMGFDCAFVPCIQRVTRHLKRLPVLALPESWWGHPLFL